MKTREAAIIVALYCGFKWHNKAQQMMVVDGRVLDIELVIDMFMSLDALSPIWEDLNLYRITMLPSGRTSTPETKCMEIKVRKNNVKDRDRIRGEGGTSQKDALIATARAIEQIWHESRCNYCKGPDGHCSCP